MTLTAKKMLLPITSDGDGFQLTGAPDAEPIAAGASFTYDGGIQSPAMTFARLLIWGVEVNAGHRWVFRKQEALRSHAIVGCWRIDEVRIDGVVYDIASRVPGPGPWGIGRFLRMVVTNVGGEPAHFSAIWELEGSRSVPGRDQLGCGRFGTRGPEIGDTPRGTDRLLTRTKAMARW